MPNPSPLMDPRTEKGLTKTRNTWFRKVTNLLGGNAIAPEAWDELEEALIGSDVGLDLSEDLIARTRERVQNGGAQTPEHLRQALRDELVGIASGAGADTPPDSAENGMEIILMTGVNGSGKTTSIAKLAHRKKAEGRRVLLVAADTFRAAAIEQLSAWGRTLNVDVIAQRRGADPGAVVFDGVSAAQARGIDTLIIDTAGRLQAKTQLMEELKKIRRVIDRAHTGATVTVLLVLDATTGQNGLSQAREFLSAVGVDAIILTKVDGTSKGGIALAIRHEFGLPIAYIATGEGVDDLAPFDAESFVGALVG